MIKKQRHENTNKWRIRQALVTISKAGITFFEKIMIHYLFIFFVYEKIMIKKQTNENTNKINKETTAPKKET